MLINSISSFPVSDHKPNLASLRFPSLSASLVWEKICRIGRHINALRLPIADGLSLSLEMAVIWNLKQPYVLWKGCKFLYTAATDPCLYVVCTHHINPSPNVFFHRADWESTGHTNIYASGPASYAHSYKTSASLPYRDMWSMAGPVSHLSGTQECAY